MTRIRIISPSPEYFHWLTPGRERGGAGVADAISSSYRPMAAMIAAIVPSLWLIV